MTTDCQHFLYDLYKSRGTIIRVKVSLVFQDGAIKSYNYPVVIDDMAKLQEIVVPCGECAMKDYGARVAQAEYYKIA